MRQAVGVQFKIGIRKLLAGRDRGQSVDLCSIGGAFDEMMQSAWRLRNDVPEFITDIRRNGQDKLCFIHIRFQASQGEANPTRKRAPSVAANRINIFGAFLNSGVPSSPAIERRLGGSDHRRMTWGALSTTTNLYNPAGGYMGCTG